MNAFIKSVALNIDKDTPYLEALRIFNDKKINSDYHDHNFSRHLDTQAMLVYNDPNVKLLVQRIKSTTTFKQCFQKFINFPWNVQKPSQKKLGNKTYIFPNQTACNIFCYHPSIVHIWRTLRGSPKGFRVPEKRWNFKYETQEQTNHKKEEESEMKVYVKCLPPGALWADYCDTSSDED